MDDNTRICRRCGLTDGDEVFDGVDGFVPQAWMDEEIHADCYDAEQEEIGKNAARYVWLRDRSASNAALDAGSLCAGQPGLGLVLTGDHLDNAIDRAMGDETDRPVPLETRLAQCLADIVDKPILSGRDEVGAHTSPLDIRLGFFHPDLAERAAELLEEAGL